MTTALAAVSKWLWNPIIAKELRSRMRSWHAMAVLTGYLCVIGGFGFLTYESDVSGSVSVVQVGAVGSDLFTVLSAAVMVTVALVVPGLVSPAISGERERKTLELLLVTPLRPARIVIGKLVASLAFMVLLIVACLPLFSVAFLLGGVAASQVLGLLGFTLMGVFCLGALAMFTSTTFRRISTSSVLSYLAMLALLAGPLVLGFGTERAFYNSSATRPPVQLGLQPLAGAPGVIYSLSPVVGVVGILENGNCSGTGLFSAITFSNAAVSCGPSSLFTTDMGPFGTWRTWQVTVVAEVLLTAAALGGSIAVLRRREVS
ncbi:MAG TPA: ABC transporter permease [Acidimicrobiales bacterium]|nr:ABC transporter permease [Acidimicrobiales bacterium]